MFILGILYNSCLMGKSVGSHLALMLTDPGTPKESSPILPPRVTHCRISIGLPLNPHCVNQSELMQTRC
jgi:hypothetical protein